MDISEHIRLLGLRPHSDVAHVGHHVLPSVNDDSGRMSGQDDLCVRIEVANHSDEAFLPFEMQACFGFVHEKHVGLSVFSQHGEQDDEHLLLAARKQIRLQRLVILYEIQFVALSVDAFSRLPEEIVHQVLEMRFNHGRFSGLSPRFWVARRKQFNHAVRHVDLIVEVSALKLIELPVEFRRDASVRQLVELFDIDEASVETAYDVIMNARGISRLEVDFHAQAHPFDDFSRRWNVAQVLDEAVEDGALSGAVAAAEHVDIRAHVPHDVFVATP